MKTTSFARSNAQGTGNVDPVKFASLHTDYLKEAVANSNSKKLSPKDAFMLVTIPNITKEEQSKIFDYFNTKLSQQKGETFKSLESAKARELYEQVEASVNSTATLQELNKRLDGIAAEADKSLAREEWDILMVFIETSRSSADFWYPKDMGGSGLGTDYAYAAQAAKDKKKLPGWVRADGVGAGLGMATWGLSGLFVAGPVGGVAGFLYGAVSGAVTSSMTAHINWND